MSIPEAKAEVVEELPKVTLYIGVFKSWRATGASWCNTLPYPSREEAFNDLCNAEGVNKHLISYQVPDSAMLEDVKQ